MRQSVDKRLFALALLVSAAAGSWWWSRLQSPETAAIAHDRTREADYYLTGFELTETDSTGAIAHRLSGDDLYHYPADGTSTLTRPHLLVYADGRAAWDATADQGLVLEQDHRVHLSGRVAVRYAGATADGDTRLYTDELDVWPDDKRAETAAAVRIEERTGVTRGIGMTADIARRQAVLRARVEGDYAPG